MLVRKFEAKTIKQAIDLVKTELGPEAIILAARENDGRFGMMGETSVEVTAAISEHKLREKQLAERKLNAKNKEAFLKASARTQKEFIQKATPKIPLADSAAEIKGPSRPKTAVPYVDIPEDFVESAPAAVPVAKVVAPIEVPMAPDEIDRLKSEISQLKGLLSQFQKMPQGFSSLHPGAEAGVSYDLSFAYQKLTQAGLETDYVVDILAQAEQALPTQQKKKRPLVEGWLIKRFLDEVQIQKKPTAGKYHVFVGPTGQGKTSTVVKLACHLVLKERKRVAVLSADSVKVGAKDQLKIYCQILNIPFGHLDKPVDWVTLDQKLKDFDHVLIDTAGVNLRAASDMDLVKKAIPHGLPLSPRIHYVQSIMVRDRDAFDIADRFKLFGFEDVIFTRLDEAVQHGFLLNFSRRYKAPILAFGTGTAAPECFEFATKERVIDLLFSLSNHNQERGHS